MLAVAELDQSPSSVARSVKDSQPKERGVDHAIMLREHQPKSSRVLPRPAPLDPPRFHAS